MTGRVGFSGTMGPGFSGTVGPGFSGTVGPGFSGTVGQGSQVPWVRVLRYHGSGLEVNPDTDIVTALLLFQL